MLRRIIPFAACFVFILTFSSCFQDRWPEYAGQTRLDTWIDSIMRQDYLWYKDIPNSKELNYFSRPDKFLQTIISRTHDNKYSHVDTIREIPEPSYGFDYTLYRNAHNDTLFNILVTYVQPNSPADRAGLKRGQWIAEINDSTITRKNEPLFLQSGRPLKLQMGVYAIEMVDEMETGVINKTDIVQLDGAEPVEDTPVHYYTILDTSNGPTGYIVYSHFTSGTRIDPEKYNNQLRSIFQKFSENGVTNLILDLRYNRGGSLATAQVVASLTASAGEMGQPLASLEYNSKKQDKNQTLTFNKDLIGGMQPLEIQQGVIISGGLTSGVTGVLLNCLAPFNKWALVGNSVKCPGVATEEFIYPLGTWALHPVTCYVKNAEGVDNSGNTFKANISASETSDLLHFLPFGNPEETLLQKALSIIEGSYQPDQKTHQQPELIREVKASRTNLSAQSGCRL